MGKVAKVELYEDTYKGKEHFSFGSNWLEYIRKLDKHRIEEAKKSLVYFLGNIKGKTFVDVGCGSGLFSLAAVKLGAHVTSVDIDDNSLECARIIKKKFAKDSKNWKIVKASALDAKTMQSLGKFDIVYSWGVLHHTGDMKKAIANTAGMAKKGSLFFIAIYNDNSDYRLEGTSSQWVRLKKLYNNSGKITKKILYYAYTPYLLAGVTASGKNPVSYVRNYKTLRGMDFFTDVKDWLGGYPYEYGSVKQIASLVEKKGFTLIKINKARSLGCNEFVFRKK